MLTGRSASAFLPYGWQSQILFTSRLGWSLVLELRTQRLVSLLSLRSWQPLRYRATQYRVSTPASAGAHICRIYSLKVRISTAPEVQQIMMRCGKYLCPEIRYGNWPCGS